MNNSKSPCNQKCINKDKCIEEKGEKTFRKDASILIYCDKYEKDTSDKHE